MLIRVMYWDGRQDRVRASQLQSLIEAGQIKMFKRFSGWVSVRTDPTREKKGPSIEAYEGRERRKKRKKKHASYPFLDEPSDF